jgi:predicted nuclease of predicted toxin-antitoxin system
LLLELRFLVDAQLPPRLARQLTSIGFPAAHVTERLSATATDREIAQLANALGAAVISKDEDFVDLLGRRVLETGLVWVRCGNVTPEVLWALIEPNVPEVIRQLEAGRQVVEVPALNKSL